MNNLRNIHTKKKEKEIILSLFRLPLNFFARDSDEWEVEIESHFDDTTLTPQKNIQHLEIPEETSQQKLKSTIHSTPNQTNDSTTVDTPSSNTTPTIEPVESVNQESPSSTTANPSPTQSASSSTEASTVPKENSTQPAQTTNSTLHPNPSVNNIAPTATSDTTPTSTASSQKTPPPSGNSSSDTTSPQNQPNHQAGKATTPSTNSSNDTTSSQNQPNTQTNKTSDSGDSSKKSSSDLQNSEENSSKEKEPSEKKSPDEKEQQKTAETENKTPSEKRNSEDKQASEGQAQNKTLENSNNATSPNKESSPIADARNMQKKSPTDKPASPPENSNSPLANARNMAKKTVDGAKDRAKNLVPKKARDTFDAAKNKVNGAKNAMAPALDTAKNVNKFMNGSAQDKTDAVADAATKAATAALKAANAPIGMAVEAADKVLGNSEMGKAAKRTLLGCATFSCCSTPLIAFLPIFLFIFGLSSIFGWIFGLFSDTDVEAAITEETIFAETRTGENTVYSILENKLRDETFGFQVIQRDEYGNYLYDEENQLKVIPIGNSYPGTFSDIYTYNQLSPQGQFATAYEFLISNYTVSMIKEPRHDTGMSSKHMPLFQNVLEEDFKTLRNQFHNTEDEDGQVPDTFWNKLNECLRVHYYVYNPITGEDIYVSLYDLLLETSSTDGDAEYDTTTVEAILNYTENEKNLELATEFRRLQEALTRIEVMTYMMSIRNFYDQKNEFLEKLEFDSLSGKAAENYSFFADGAFFDQFLLIPDVESYMALSSTTATPAFAYDIAVASMFTLEESNAPRVTHNGKVYYFFETMKTWAASYTFYNSIVPKKTGTSTTEPETGTTTGDDPLANLEEEEYSLFCTDIVPTKLEENLYKRYNITDPDSFFNFFEISTGIKISTETDASTFFLVTNMLPHEVEGSFPLAAKTSITHGYGQEYSQETIKKFNLSHGDHTGVDFSAKIGTPVLAIKEGTVSKISYDPGWGHYIIIKHPGDYYSLYAHGNGNFSVGEGSSVSAGSQIMESGNSGNSTGPHLHLQVYKGTPSNHVNPISYINGTLGMASISSDD